MEMFVRCRHEAGEAEFPAAAVESMRALGWEPVSEPRTFSEAQDGETRAAQEPPDAVPPVEPADEPVVGELTTEVSPPASRRRNGRAEPIDDAGEAPVPEKE